MRKESELRVIHVVPAIAEEASGPSYSVVRLCQALIDAGDSVTLATLDWSRQSRLPVFAKAFPLGSGPSRLGRSPRMLRWLGRVVKEERVDVIHNHGMWQMNAVYPGWVARGGRARLVVSPRGALSPWSMRHGSITKGIFWPLLQRPAFASASCFHATADSEGDEIRLLGFKQPVAVIPNGVDVPEHVPADKDGPRTLLFLGRIHPKKGVDILLKSWAAVMDRHPDWRLLIGGDDRGYGDGTGYLADMKAVAAHLRLDRVVFAGAMYGNAKLSAYRNAQLFVLPTHSENFGMTVAEALAAGTPAVVTKGAPWGGLEENGAGWWIDAGVDALAAALDIAMAVSPEELARRGSRGRQWMLREFSWHKVGKQMHETYRWLREGGAPPPWIRLN